MGTEIRRGIVIGLGRQGSQVVTELENRMQRRHGPGGIPIIQTLVLLKADDLPASPGDATETGLESKTLRFTLPEEEPDRKSEVNTWLPDIQDLTLKHRAGARLALLTMAGQIRDRLNNIIDEKLLSSQTDMPPDLAVSSSSAKTIDIYLVANVGEAFAGGVLIDLAYLINQICYEKRADDLYFEVNGLLLLPQLAPEWRGTAGEAKTLQANAYAALKELDYYMTAPPYRLRYFNGRLVEFPPRRELREGTRKPFDEPGRCYLLSPANENNETIDPADAINMMAEWLYHIFIVGIYNALNAERQDKPSGDYSSLGLASLVLPMRYIRDYCARRLAAEMADRLLLKATRRYPQQTDLEDRLRLDFQNWQIGLDDLDEKLRGRRDHTDQAYSIPQTAYDALSRFEYQALEKKLIHDYDHRLREIWPQIKNRMLLNKKQLEDQLINDLRQDAYKFFNHDNDPAIALDRSLKFFERLLNRVRSRQHQVSQQINAYQIREQQESRQIKEKRGRYFNAAQTFGQTDQFPPMRGGVVTGAAFFIFFIYSYLIIGAQLAQPLTAITLIGLSLTFIIIVAYLTLQWINTTRAGYISQYNSRLQTHRRLEEARLEANLLGRIETWGESLQSDIVKFRDEMYALQSLAEQRWQTDHGHSRPWSDLLFGYPYFSLEESVIAEEDLETYYREIRGEADKGLDNHLVAFFGSGRHSGDYCDWLTQNLKADEAMWPHLYDYSAQQSLVLNEHHIVEKLEERYDKQTMREQIEVVKGHAQPFLRTRQSELGEFGQTIFSERFVVYSDENIGQTGFGQALQTLQLLPKLVVFHHRHRFSAVTLRHGLPLYILPEVVNCEPGYHEVIDLNQVHTTRGNIALPAISKARPRRPDLADALIEGVDPEFAWRPRQAFALALALGCFQLPFKSLFYKDEAGSPGPAPNAQPASAGYYQVYIEARQLEIARKLNRPPRQTEYFLGPTKAEACLTLYTEPAVFSYLRRDLRTYLLPITGAHQELSGLVGALTDYLPGENVSDGERPDHVLEDWEIIELERAIDMLLPLLPDPAGQRPDRSMSPDRRQTGEGAKNTA